MYTKSLPRCAMKRGHHVGMNNWSDVLWRGKMRDMRCAMKRKTDKKIEGTNRSDGRLEVTDRSLATMGGTHWLGPWEELIDE